jgi:hypothetical protein
MAGITSSNFFLLPVAKKIVLGTETFAMFPAAGLQDVCSLENAGRVVRQIIAQRGPQTEMYWDLASPVLCTM